MIKQCVKCGSMLSSVNTIKKDVNRFNKLCYSCFKEKRNKYRAHKKQEQLKNLNTLIDKNIIKVEIEPYFIKHDIITDNLWVRSINFIKDIIRKITDALQ